MLNSKPGRYSSQHLALKWENTVRVAVTMHMRGGFRALTSHERGQFTNYYGGTKGRQYIRPHACVPLTY